MEDGLQLTSSKRGTSSHIDDTQTSEANIDIADTDERKELLKRDASRQSLGNAIRLLAHLDDENDDDGGDGGYGTDGNDTQRTSRNLQNSDTPQARLSGAVRKSSRRQLSHPIRHADESLLSMENTNAAIGPQDLPRSDGHPSPRLSDALATPTLQITPRSNSGQLHRPMLQRQSTLGRGVLAKPGKLTRGDSIMGVDISKFLTLASQGSTRSLASTPRSIRVSDVSRSPEIQNSPGQVDELKILPLHNSKPKGSLNQNPLVEEPKEAKPTEAQLRESIFDRPRSTSIRSTDESLEDRKARMFRPKLGRSVSMQDVNKREGPNLISELRTFYMGSTDSIESIATGLTDEEKSTFDHLHSDQMLLMRESIRFSARIRSLLTMVWLAADADFSGKLDHTEYMLLNQKLQVAVIGEFDPVEGVEMAQRDWTMDSQGRHHLNFSRFSQSWFQIVDLWTDDVDEDLYYDFLYQLVQRLLIRDKDGTLRFRENHEILSQDEYNKLVASGKWKHLNIAENPMIARQMYCPKEREKASKERKKRLLQEKKRAAATRAAAINRLASSTSKQSHNDDPEESKEDTQKSRIKDNPAFVMQDVTSNARRRFTTSKVESTINIRKLRTKTEMSNSKDLGSNFLETGSKPKTKYAQLTSEHNMSSRKLGTVQFGKLDAAKSGDIWGSFQRRRRSSRSLSLAWLQDPLEGHERRIERRRLSLRPQSACAILQREVDHSLHNDEPESRITKDITPYDVSRGNTNFEEQNLRRGNLVFRENHFRTSRSTKDALLRRRESLKQEVQAHGMHLSPRACLSPLDEFQDNEFDKAMNEVEEVLISKPTRNKPYVHNGLSVLPREVQLHVLQLAYALQSEKEDDERTENDIRTVKRKITRHKLAHALHANKITVVKHLCHNLDTDRICGKLLNNTTLPEESLIEGLLGIVDNGT